jgi:RHS repeat-associated protein
MYPYRNLPRLAVAEEADPNNPEQSILVPHIVWIHFDTTDVFPYHCAIYNGVSTPPVKIADQPAFDVDVAASAFEPKAHATFASGGQVRMAVRGTGLTGGWGSPEAASTAGGSVPRIAVDSRGQPNVLWMVPGGPKGKNFAYARKVQGQWKRQENIEILGRGQDTLDLVRNDNDGLYAISGKPSDTYTTAYYFDQEIHEIPVLGPSGGNVYSLRTFEPNLGAQDGLVHLGVAPSTSVNVATGGVVHSLPLFSASGVGLPAGFSLVYNSLEWDRGVITPGWSHSYHVTLTDHHTGVLEDDDRITIQFGDGRAVVFKGKQGDDKLLAFDDFGYFAKLQRGPGVTMRDGTGVQYLLTTRNNLQYGFDQGDKFGKLAKILDSNDNNMRFEYRSDPDHRVLEKVHDSTNRMTELAYDDEDRLKTIKDPKTRSYTVAYDAATKKLKTVTYDAASPSMVWEYKHFQADDPASESDPKQKINLMSEIKEPRGNTFKLTYYRDNRLRSTQDPELAIRTSETAAGVPAPPQHPEQKLDYTEPPEPDGTNLPKVEFTNRRSAKTSVEVEYRRSLARKVTDADQKTVSRTFDGTYRNLKSATDREGNQTSYTYAHEGGGGELPNWVKDLVRSVSEPGANAPSGGGGSSTTGTYQYTSNDDGNTFRVREFTDALGHVTTYEYDSPAKGNLKKVIYPPGADGHPCEESMGVDSKGRVTEHTSPNGGVTRYVYGDAATGLVTDIYLPGHSRAHRMQYDTMGNPEHSIRPMGGDTVTAYDGLYRPTSVTAPAGDADQSSSFQYEANGLVSMSTGPGGAVTQYTYDELGRLITSSFSISSGGTAKSEFYYDPEGNVVRSSDPRSKEAKATYDQMNRRRTQEVPGAPGPAIKSEMDWSGNGWLKESRLGTAGLLTSTFTLSGRGQVLERISPIPSIKDKTEYYADGLPMKASRLDGATEKNATVWNYNGRRELTSITQLMGPGGTSAEDLLTLLKRDCNGNVVEVTDPRGKKRTIEFDLSDRPVRWKDALGSVVREARYNDNDLVEEDRIAHPETNVLVTASSRTFNPRDEVKSVTDSFGNTARMTYDGRGNVVRVDRPGGSLAIFRYDNRDLLIEEVRQPGAADQIAISRRYDENGNLVRIGDPRGHAYRLDYDDANRLKSYTYPDGGVESWGYDDKGRVQTFTDRNGKVATYVYDALGRVTRETHRRGEVIADVEREYDGASNLEFQHDHKTGILLVYPLYDKANRLRVMETYLNADGGALTLWSRVEYEYDEASNLKKLTDPEGVVYDYAYDDNSRLGGITRTPAGQGGTIIATFSYSTSGHRQELRLAGGVRTGYDYDAKGRLLSMSTTAPDGKVLSRYDYTYDERDLRTKARLVHLNVEVSYGYDLHDRLTSEVWTGNTVTLPDLCATGPLPEFAFGNAAVLADAPVAAGSPVPVGTLPVVPVYEAYWTYDAAGNRLHELERPSNGAQKQTDYVYDAVNRLTAESSNTQPAISYDYDAHGNLTLRSQGGVEERFSYDYQNRAVSYRKGPAGGAAQASWRYVFDPSGARLAKIDAIGGQEEWFKYDGANVTADYTRPTSSGGYALARTYVNQGLDGKIARIDQGPGGEETKYYLGDAVGSVHMLVSSAGAVLQQHLQTAWGKDLPGFLPTQAPGLPRDRHGLAQRERDDESGLVYMRARLYDPRIGRFTQTDPIRGNRHLKHYAYCSGNPVSRTDPLGLQEPGDEQDIIRQLENRRAFFSNPANVVSEVNKAAVQNPVAVGAAAGYGAGEAFFVGAWEFFYYGTQNVVYQLTGAEAYSEGAEWADQFRKGVVVMFTTDPREVWSQAAQHAAEDLEGGSLAGSRDFGRTLFGYYAVGRTVQRSASATVRVVRTAAENRFINSIASLPGDSPQSAPLPSAPAAVPLSPLAARYAALTVVERAKLDAIMAIYEEAGQVGVNMKTVGIGQLSNGQLVFSITDARYSAIVFDLAKKYNGVAIIRMGAGESPMFTPPHGEVQIMSPGLSYPSPLSGVGASKKICWPICQPRLVDSGVVPLTELAPMPKTVNPGVGK